MIIQSKRDYRKKEVTDEQWKKMLSMGMNNDWHVISKESTKPVAIPEKVTDFIRKTKPKRTPKK
ncbi:MAG: hypothetical protein WC341_07775 [Bacteroidales bacterium]|jgi:hypothetical protein